MMNEMILKYEIQLLLGNGLRTKSAGRYKTYENAKKTLKKLYKVVPQGINAYRIVNTDTGIIVEQSGRM